MKENIGFIRKIIITTFIAGFVFALSPSKTLADCATGWTCNNPATAVVQSYGCKLDAVYNCKQTSSPENTTMSCDSECAFQKCSTNDLPLSCGWRYNGQPCDPTENTSCKCKLLSSCSTPGNCCILDSDPDPDPDPDPEPDPTPPPSCTVSGPPNVMVGSSGTFSVSPANATSWGISSKPTDSSAGWTTVLATNSSSYAGSFQCTASGNQYVVCGANSSATNQQCSGNPWCMEWPPVADPSVTCTGYIDCYSKNDVSPPNDVIQISCLPPPTCSISAVVNPDNSVTVNWTGTSNGTVQSEIRAYLAKRDGTNG